MLIHFEDWSHPLVTDLLPQDLPHESRVIKAFATETDPRIELNKRDLVVIEASGDVFDRDEVFEYDQRGAFASLDLEEMLGEYDLSDLGNRTVRALFRFSNEYGFCQEAMSARRNDGWLIAGPLDEIDGYNNAGGPGYESALHLDIFFPKSLGILKDTVNYDSPDEVLTVQEVMSQRRNSLKRRQA